MIFTLSIKGLGINIKDIKTTDTKATNNLLRVVKIRYKKLNMIPMRGPLVCVKTNMNKKTKPDNTK